MACNNCFNSCCNCDCCNPCCEPNENFIFTKINAVTGVGISGAVFQLRDQFGNILTETSDMWGNVKFRIEPCMNYILTEVVAPEGYELSDITYTVMITEDGRLFINGVLTANFRIGNTPLINTVSFTIQKIDSVTEVAIAGAGFELRQGTSIIAAATSTATGALSFTNILPGQYTLVETIAPAGYQIDTIPEVIVVAEDGTVTINGENIATTPIVNMETARLAFFNYVLDTTTPVVGSVFTLTNTITSATDTATSNAVGLVDFGTVTTGTYTLTQTSVPATYIINPTVLSVSVNNIGTVTVDGLPITQFIAYNELATPVG